MCFGSLLVSRPQIVYFAALQDIHLIALEFWSTLRFGLRIGNGSLPQDEQDVANPDLTDQEQDSY